MPDQQTSSGKVRICHGVSKIGLKEGVGRVGWKSKNRLVESVSLRPVIELEVLSCLYGRGVSFDVWLLDSLCKTVSLRHGIPQRLELPVQRVPRHSQNARSLGLLSTTAH